MALNGLLCADVSLRTYTPTHYSPLWRYIADIGVCCLAAPDKQRQPTCWD